MNFDDAPGACNHPSLDEAECCNVCFPDEPETAETTLTTAEVAALWTAQWAADAAARDGAVA